MVMAAMAVILIRVEGDTGDNTECREYDQER
jgi:hypothetical protein